MKRNIFFTGEMKEKFGEKIVLDTESLHDVIKGISANRPEFKNYVISLLDKDLDIRVYHAGKYLTDDDGPLFPLEEGDLILSVAPSGRFELFTAITSALVAILPFLKKAAVYFITGKITDTIAEMLAPEAYETEEGEETYLFSGPRNRFLSGKTLPIVYGEIRAGGFPINIQIVSQPFDAVETYMDPEGNIYAGRG
jgi:predicted phage tail protein